MKIGLSSSRLRSIAPATSSVALFQRSVTESRRSSAVIHPSSYWLTMLAASTS